MTEAIKAQYEAYPYPTRNPADEKTRLVIGTPSCLSEVEHYIFGGRIDPTKRLRVLVAGGGTGDAAIMLAQQLLDRGLPASVTHLDLSATSQEIAQKRAAMRALDIHFIQDSLLNAVKYGPFDYIDCCGVLHHLENPDAGLAALKSALAPGGGMGIMVYAPLGRTGVYPMQHALRLLTAHLEPAEKVAIAKKVFADLPDGAWIKKNHYLNDHLVSDAGVYDLFLHSQDRAYTVSEFHNFVTTAGLEIVQFMEPIKYEPDTYLKDPAVIRLLPTDRLERAVLAEQLGGNLFKHIAYIADAKRAANAAAQNSPDMIPVYKEDFDGLAVAKVMTPDRPLIGQLNGLRVALPMPRRTAAIMQRIDGQRSWREIHANLVEKLGRDAPAWEAYWSDVEEIWRKFQSINVACLRRPEA